MIVAGGRSSDWLPASASGAICGFVLGLAAGLQTARAAHAFDQVGDRLTWLRASGRTLGDLFTACSAQAAVGALTMLVMYAVNRDQAVVATSMDIMDVLRNPATADEDLVFVVLLSVVGALTLLTITNGLGAGRAGLPHRTTPRLRRLPLQLAGGLGTGLLVGAGCAALFALANRESGGGSGFGLGSSFVFAAVVAGFVGVPLGLGRWLSSPMTRQDSHSPEDLLRSDRTALFLATGGVAGAAVTITATAVWLTDDRLRIAAAASLAAAAAVASLVFFGSGSAWLSYSIARSWLAFRGRLPWRLSRFLRHAHLNGVLRQAGTAYQMRHDLVRAHLMAEYQPTSGTPPRRTATSTTRQPSVVRARRWLRALATTAAVVTLPATALAIDPRPVTIMIPVASHAPRATLQAGRLGTLSPNGDILATIDSEGARLWNADNGKLIAALDPVSGFLALGDNPSCFGAGCYLEFSPDSGSVLTFGRDRILRLWNATNGRLVAVLDRFGTTYQFVISPDGKAIATVGTDRVVRLWNLTDGQFIATLGHLRPDFGVVISSDPGPTFGPDGRALAIQGADRVIRLWNPTNGRRIAALPNTSGSFLTFSVDGGVVATSGNGAVRLWRATDGELITVLNYSSRGLWYSYGGGAVATRGADGVVRVFDLAGQQIGSLGYADEGIDLQLSPGGRFAVTDDDHVVRLWNTASGSVIATLDHVHDLGAVRFSPDGHTLAAVSESRVVRLWSVATGQPLATLDRVEDEFGIWFSPYSHHVATMGTDRVVRLWRPSTGQLAGSLGRADFAFFSPDGRTVATVDADGLWRLWNV